MKMLFIFLFMVFFHFAIAQNVHSNDIATIKSCRAASNDAISRHDVDGIARAVRQGGISFKQLP